MRLSWLCHSLLPLLSCGGTYAYRVRHSLVRRTQEIKPDVSLEVHADGVQDDGGSFEPNAPDALDEPRELEEAEDPVDLLRGGRDASILFSIQTAEHSDEAVRAAFETWASNLAPGQLQVIGMSRRKSWDLPGVYWEKSDCPDTHSGGACKDFTALASAWEKDVDWVVLLGTDNYAVASNIEEALRSRSASAPQVLGIRGCGHCAAGGLCGGGGQIFSRGALQKMVGQGRQSYLKESMRQAKECGMWGDVSNCRVAAAHQVPVKDLPGLHGWHLDASELQQTLASPYPAPLTFHYLSTQEIRALHALISSNSMVEDFGSVGAYQAQGLSSWYARRDSYVAEEEARRQKLAVHNSSAPLREN